MISVDLQIARIYDEEAQLRSFDEWNDYWSDKKDEVLGLYNRGSSLASEIRALLGLPSNIGATGSAC